MRKGKATRRKRVIRGLETMVLMICAYLTMTAGSMAFAAQTGNIEESAKMVSQKDELMAGGATAESGQEQIPALNLKETSEQEQETVGQNKEQVEATARVGLVMGGEATGITRGSTERQPQWIASIILVDAVIATGIYLILKRKEVQGGK